GAQMELMLTGANGSNYMADHQHVTLSGPHSASRREHSVVKQTGANVLLVEGLREDGTTIQLEESSSLNSLLSFMYAVEDVASLTRHTDKRAGRDEWWGQKLGEEERNLGREVDEFGDILFAEGVDVYRSLPDKLLQCHSW
ncbi:hypothetical protein BaRGS_00021688, partial [Batillaria attramentaria]